MALTLSKTGITDGQTIQVGHVTQSIDAFTKVTAYDISLSGSLTLTGSLNSFNGFTGSFTGSHFGSANLSGLFTGSFTGSLKGTLDTSFYPDGAGPNIQSAKIVAGTGTLNGGSPATRAFLVTELIGKTLGVNCFVTATLSGSAPYTGTVNVGGLTAGTLSFTGNSGNTDLFFFQAVYY